MCYNFGCLQALMQEGTPYIYYFFCELLSTLCYIYWKGTVEIYTFIFFFYWWSTSFFIVRFHPIYRRWGVLCLNCTGQDFCQLYRTTTWSLKSKKSTLQFLSLQFCFIKSYSSMILILLISLKSYVGGPYHFTNQVYAGKSYHFTK